MRYLNAHLVERFPARPLAVFRVIIGFTMVLEVPETSGFMSKQETLRADGLAAIPAIPGTIWVIFGCVYGTFAILVLVGLWTRRSLVALAVLTLYTMYFADRYQNHLAFAVCILLVTAISDSGAAWSIDALRRGPARSRDTVEAWPVTLIKLQTCTLYFFAGVNKVNPVFWTGDTIRVVADRSFLWPLPGGDPFVLVYVALGISAIIWELSAGFLLWIHGWPQKAAMIVGVMFHLGMAVTLASSWPRVHGVVIFALLTWGSYLLFLPHGPVLADRLSEWVTGHRSTTGRPSHSLGPTSSPESSTPSRLG